MEGERERGRREKTGGEMSIKKEGREEMLQV